MTKIARMIEEIEKTGFWGNLQLDFQAGRLVLIRKSETIKVHPENNSLERESTRG